MRREGSRDRDRGYTNRYGGGGSDRGGSGRNGNRYDDRDGNGGSRDHHGDDRRRERRSNSRDRKRVRSDEGDHYGGTGGGNRQNFQAPRAFQQEPCDSIIVKGLPNHTNHATLTTAIGPFYPKDIRLITQRDGECKGYAFVDFPSVEYAQHFMTSFAGSAGDPNAPQLILDNRAVILEYANARLESSSEHGRGDRRDRRPVKSDWLCEVCSCHNFARRDSCFRCSTPRSERSVLVPSTNTIADAHPDPACDVPCEILVVKGLSPMIQDNQIQELYRQYALVKSVNLIRDPATHYAKGLAFVEFHSPEFAQFALQHTNGMSFGGADMAVGGDNSISVAFAKRDIMQTLIQKANKPGAPMAVNPLVAQALQAAQWSANNGYSTAVHPSASSAVSAPTGSAPAFYPPPPSTTNATTTTPATLGSTTIPSYPTATMTAGAGNAPNILFPMRFPPNFDTNGGAYMFQAKSGYFWEPISEYFYDPKHKRYLCGKTGRYFIHNSGLNPPFELFHPPAPTAPAAASASAMNVNGDSSSTATNSGENQTANLANGSSIKIKLASSGSNKTPASGSAVGSSNSSGGVGFGFGLPVNKKVKRDIAKWGALQQDDEEEQVEEDPRFKNRRLDTTISTVGIPSKENSSLSSASAAREEPRKAVDDVPKQPIFTLTSAPVVPAVASAVRVQLPNAPIPSAFSAAAPTAATSDTAAATSAALASVCLLCQRQFPSPDMLARHERESKLHADNLKKKLLAQQQ